MNLQRMKFAWARGARLQGRMGFDKTDWVLTGLVAVGEDCRIHPDDEHLQYGPLSTALRNRVIYSEQDNPRDAYDAAAYSLWVSFCTGHREYSWPSVEYGWNMLFFAEFLADEGM